MGRYQVAITLHPPDWVERYWYWSIRLPPPAACSLTGSARWVRLLPQSWNWLHRGYARRHGLFWLRCVLCTHPYGGHQSAGSVPDPLRGPGSGRSVTICPRCTRRGGHVELGRADRTAQGGGKA